MIEDLLPIFLGLAFIGWGIVSNSFTYGDIFGYFWMHRGAPRWFGKIAQIVFGITLLAFGLHSLMVHH
jgi:hypothetical protein